MRPTLKLFFAFLAIAPIRAQADDVSHTFGVSGYLGAAFPVAPDYVTSMTDTSGLNLGGMFSLQMGPRFGVGLAYENMSLGNGTRVAPINLLVLLRFRPESRWTPTFQVGGGSARGVESDRIENLGFKTGVGLDYFVNSRLAVGPQFNYYFISHSGPATTYAHIVGLNAVVSYFFGSTLGSR